MIDMNGSIESIMEECDRIAFNEFKGDAELQHDVRNIHDKLSGNHEYSKAYRSTKRDSRDEMTGRTEKHGSVHNMNQKRSADLDKDIARAYVNKINHTKRDSVVSQALHGTKESVSIFDTLLDQV